MERVETTGHDHDLFHASIYRLHVFQDPEVNWTGEIKSHCAIAAHGAHQWLFRGLTSSIEIVLISADAAHDTSDIYIIKHDAVQCDHGIFHYITVVVDLTVCFGLVGQFYDQTVIREICVIDVMVNDYSGS